MARKTYEQQLAELAHDINYALKTAAYGYSEHQRTVFLKSLELSTAALTTGRRVTAYRHVYDTLAQEKICVQNCLSGHDVWIRIADKGNPAIDPSMKGITACNKQGLRALFIELPHTKCMP